MKIADCLPLMTQMYLARTVEGILTDEVPRNDDDRPGEYPKPGNVVHTGASPRRTEKLA
jgi:hypothetical protein